MNNISYISDHYHHHNVHTDDHSKNDHDRRNGDNIDNRYYHIYDDSDSYHI